MKKVKNGNGEEIFHIDKRTLALLVLIVTLLSAFGSVVVTATVIKTDVDYLKEGVASIQPLANQNKQDIAVVKQSLTNIEDDISEIKELLKEQRR